MTSGVARWYRLAILDSFESKSFAVTAHYNALESRTLGYGLVHTRISFTNSLASEDRIAGCAARRTTREEACDIVVDIVVTPSKDGASLVRERGKWAAEIVGQVSDGVIAIDHGRRMRGAYMIRP